MVDFTEILGKKAAEVEKPRPKPTGTYLAAVQGMPKQKTAMVQGEERKILSFSIKVMAPRGDDVDQEELADPKVGEISAWPSFNKDIWIDTPEGEHALRMFLQNTLAIEPGKKSLGEMAAEAPGKQLLVTLKHRPYTDKNTNEAEIATDIGATAAV
jgi:hypothetical protein